MSEMSYQNVYGSCSYNDYLQKIKYVEDDKYLKAEESHNLPCGYTLDVISYADTEQKNPQYTVTKASLSKCTLKKHGSPVYSYYSTYNHPRIFTQFIQHSDGHQYYPFHVDLYGISYFNLDVQTVYNYIPEGYSHNSDYPCGESFIITDIHYDKNTNFIAYGGCYWAATYDTMVGDFSNPMNFRPELISMHKVLDPEYEKIDDVDFEKWTDKALHVKADNRIYAISIDEISARLRCH